MKQISARQFRTTFGSLTESVSVVRREPSGEYVVLGAWTPASAGETPRERATRLVSAGFGASRPAPKPKR